MQLYVREALVDDVGAMVQLLLDGKLADDDDGLDFVDDYVDAMREIERTPGNYLMVGEVGGRVVSMLQLTTFRHFQHRGGKCAEIESLHVAQDMRGRGIGGRMVAHAISRATDLGCYRIQLTSNRLRPDSHRFYESHGFRATHHGYKRSLDLDWTPTRSASRRPIDADVVNAAP